MSSQLPERLEVEKRAGSKTDIEMRSATLPPPGPPARVFRPAASTHHCRMLESIGLEKMGGEVLVTMGLGSNPSISRKKWALRGHPIKAIRTGAGPVCLWLAALPQRTHSH